MDDSSVSVAELMRIMGMTPGDGPDVDVPASFKPVGGK